MKDKSIKDAVHGYITIEDPYWHIIDLSIFQRLKWIEQTSYRPLFPSARHDRFIHSIGVFHLGKKALSGFEKNSDTPDINIIESNKDSFLLACLLHDIGHAPFSHTSEFLFNYKASVKKFDSPLVQELIKCIQPLLNEDSFDKFTDDYKDTVKYSKIAEHEIMSSIIVCKKFDAFKQFFPDASNLDIDLIVRAIIGCCYSSNPVGDNENDREKGIKNCLIRLLNSSTIDVDKLDYIARDTMMTGYDNIVIDTARLLDSITMVCHEHVFYPAYKKSAISVITNVVTAKTLQAKWIVNHPTIVYDSFLLEKSVIISLKNFADKIKIDGDDFIRLVFSSNALLEEGIRIDSYNNCLLSDIDILYIIKQDFDNPQIYEYFCRDHRKKPIWKSHEEFLYCLDCDREKARNVSSFLAPLNTLFENAEFRDSFIIDRNLKERVSDSGNISDKDSILEILTALEEFDNDNFEYILLPANNRFVPKVDNKKVFIRFGDSETDFTTLFQLQKSQVVQEETNYPFFYLYACNHIDPHRMLNFLNSKSKIRP